MSCCIVAAMDIHETVHMHEAKVEAKELGRAGRWRGKAKARQNNKARGGKLAR